MRMIKLSDCNSHKYVSAPLSGEITELSAGLSHLAMLAGKPRLAVPLVLAGRSDWQGRRSLVLAGSAGQHFRLDVLSDGHALVPALVPALVSGRLRALKYRLERLVDVLGLGGDSEGQSSGLEVRPASSLHRPAGLSSLDLDGSVGRDVIVLPPCFSLSQESLLLQLVTERFAPRIINMTGAAVFRASPLTII